MTFPTTHKERVAMIREMELDDLNGMWLTLIDQGTDQAISEFARAMVGAGHTLHVGQHRPLQLGQWRERTDR